eukprot:TRINITY_DN5410_c0_g5_i1.p1 TRINITY_DN5410_c0_g5~~TRINITY_DN5410_c0_g5_i1.p1  ORF type:complete len:530 (+),score=87.30 TRINITY_DN5410_c0_g5_i1:39-1628(+)
MIVVEVTNDFSQAPTFPHVPKEPSRPMWNIFCFFPLVDLGSAHVKEKMESLHENIKVLTHPLHMPVKWSHHQKLVVVDQQIGFVGGIDLAFGRYDDKTHKLFDPLEWFWPGKDYYNPILAPLEKLSEPFTNSLDRETQPRMGWHDIHLMVKGEAAKDLAINFIERWNHAKFDMEKVHLPFLLPSLSMDADIQSTGTLNLQIVRSLGSWHLPNFREYPETSIYSAYLHFIQTAKHYIYIENQFFVSSTAGFPVQNKITSVLLDKLRHMIKEKCLFRVYVVMPLHPEGPFHENLSLRCIMQWQYKTIGRGESSILESLAKEFPETNLEDYISFYSLRKHQEIPGTGNKFATQPIYVHSKLLIVDDKTVIIGSSNINDRSMLGDRDSEIACIVEDDEEMNTLMNNKPYVASTFAHNLRKQLWSEHLDLHYLHPNYCLLSDPIHPTTFNFWLSTAKNNTLCYRKLFPGIIDDSITTIKDINVEPTLIFHESETCKHLFQINGNLVLFPVNFLGMGDSLTDGTDFSTFGDDVFT